MIELTAADGARFSAYRAEPADTPKGAVVVLQDIFGLTPEIRKAVDAFAAKGYVAIAPSLFDRVSVLVTTTAARPRAPQSAHRSTRSGRSPTSRRPSTR